MDTFETYEPSLHEGEERYYDPESDEDDLSVLTAELSDHPYHKEAQRKLSLSPLVHLFI
jgi:hypothetical protein